MTYGFVYFLTNPSMPGITKIGFTLKHPRERMAELSAATACPQPFELLAFFDTPFPREVEAAIHESLSWCRVNGRREFFRAPLEALRDQAREWGNNNEDGCWVMELLDVMIATESANRDYAALMASVL